MGAKSGSMPFSAMTLVSACGMWAMLVTTAPLAEQIGSRGENTPSTPNISMNQPSFEAASSPDPAMAPAWPTARVSLAFQRPTTQATMGFFDSRPSS